VAARASDDVRQEDDGLTAADVSHQDAPHPATAAAAAAAATVVDETEVSEPTAAGHSADVVR